LGLGVIWAARRFALSGERTFMLCGRAGYAAGGLLGGVRWRVGPLPPRASAWRYGALGDRRSFFILAVLGMYLTRPRAPAARSRTSEASGGRGISPGDVMSV